MKRFTLFLLLLATSGSLISLPEQTNSSGSKNRQSGKTESKKASEPSRGEIVFEENCSRCHNAPQGFPPQISATIARHMRVRASLSAADEKALLKFLNP